MKKGDAQTDPKGLIYEAFRIEGITPPECRSIFLDWALSLPAGAEASAAITSLIAEYGEANPDHPMTSVLVEGQTKMAAPRRRGGWRSRQRN